VGWTRLRGVLLIKPVVVGERVVVAIDPVCTSSAVNPSAGCTPAVASQARGRLP
jgi:hypothetical protein